MTPQMEIVGRYEDGSPLCAYFIGDGDPVPGLLASIGELEKTNAEQLAQMAATDQRHAYAIATLQADLSEAHGERIANEQDAAAAEARIAELEAVLAAQRATLVPHDIDDFDAEACTPDCPPCTTARQGAGR